jgi:hypothetical protein
MQLGLSAAGSWVSPNKGYRQHHVILESRGAPTATDSLTGGNGVAAVTGEVAYTRRR